MKNKTNNTDYLILALFGIAGILVYGVQLVFPNPQPNPRETTLYTVLQLIISISFGWILQRIDSRRQYQQSLRQFALSAYRRISDIEKSVKKIKVTIVEKRINYPKDKAHELDILEVVVEELGNTVNSSILDWADIIGEEISKKEKIELLQIEQQELKSRLYNKSKDDETLQRLEEVREEINSLRSDLPLLLQKDLSTTSDILVRSPYDVVNHYSKEAEMYSFIRFHIKLYDFGDGVNIEAIRQGSPYAVILHHHDTTFRIRVIDKNGNLIGEIENPFPAFRHEDFVSGFIGVINAVTNLDGLSHQINLANPLVLKNANISTINEKYMELIIPAKWGDFAGG